MNVFVSEACFLGPKKYLDLPTSKFVSFILKSKGLYGFAENVIPHNFAVGGSRFGWKLLS